MRALIPLLAMFSIGCIYPCGGHSGPLDDEEEDTCEEGAPIGPQSAVLDLWDANSTDEPQGSDSTIQGDLEIFEDVVVLIYTDVNGNTFEVTWDRLD